MYYMQRILTSVLCLICVVATCLATGENRSADGDVIRLSSEALHGGSSKWQMKKADELAEGGQTISTGHFSADDWMEAVVPGTVLNSLVYNKKYPEPYYGLNNKIESGLIPDISVAGRDFYTYWFRTEFDVPESFRDKIVWLKADGINYRAEIWVNGHLVGTPKGMFMQNCINVTDYVKEGKGNVLAVKVYPVDAPGSTEPKSWGAPGEFRNGGNGEIGLNTTMLMSVGWDFTFMDGIREIGRASCRERV